MSDVAIKKALRNPVYLGQARQGSFSKEAAHEPLVTRQLFDQVQLARTISTPFPRTGTTAGKTLTQGLSRCASCDWKLQVSTDRRGLRFACRNAHCTARVSAQV